MKYVPIVPQGAEKLLHESERVFCFADLAYKSSRYRNWYRRARQEVLMDHPIYELQPALSIENTLMVISAVQPDMTTIPDVHEDYETTMKMFHEYAPIMRHEFSHVRLMGVPQGLDVGTILKSAHIMMESGLCDTLAIGIKRSIPDLDRAYIVHTLHVEYPDLRFHLLGARWPYTNEASMANWPWVESLDSAEPVNAGLNGYRLADLSDLKIATLATKRPNFFNSLGRIARNPKHFEIIRENIKWMESLLNATSEDLLVEVPTKLELPS